MRLQVIVAMVFVPAAVVSRGPYLRADDKEDPAIRARRFIAEHEAEVRPLEKRSQLAWWDANVSGRDEDFKAKEDAQNRLDRVLARKDRFAELRGLKEASIADPLLRRQVEILYLQYLEKQVDPVLLERMNAKANAVEQAFNAYRAKVDGVEMTDSEVRKVLKESRDPARRKAVWEASKGVGPVLEKGLRELIALRNESAKALGFPDYHAMQLALNEQSREDVLRLFDELDGLTREPFRKAKEAVDARLARDQGARTEDLRPWSYHDPFFQESPAVFDVDLDKVFAGVDILKLCRDYYAGIGLPIDDVIARSDLYEKPKKSPHAFCTDIDREGDVRVLANIVPNHYWMSTMLHELGHSVYSSKFMPRSVPYVLRVEAHILSTEGYAMMMERAASSGAWLEAMGVRVPDRAGFDEAGRGTLRNQLLIFSRWCQVMFRFEKELYSNPGADLNRLWWELVARYQMLRPPEGRDAPDWASKVHIVTSPCYYHNYMLGELFASQVHHAIAREVLKAPPADALYVGKPAVGTFLKERLFARGRTLSWNELTKAITGEELNPKAFAEDFQAR